MNMKKKTKPVYKTKNIYLSMEKAPDQVIVLNPRTMGRIMIVIGIIVLIALVAFGIFYQFQIHKNKDNFQEQVQMWVGDNGLIFLVTWIVAMSAVTLAALSLREYLPLWLSEFRTWSHFKQSQTSLLIKKWNDVIGQPQFASILTLVNSSLGVRNAPDG